MCCDDAMGIDLAELFVARSMPVIFMLLTSSESICDLITLFAPGAFSSHVEEAYGAVVANIIT